MSFNQVIHFKIKYFRYAGVNSALLYANNETCLDYKYENMIKEMSNTTWEAAANGGLF